MGPRLKAEDDGARGRLCGKSEVMASVMLTNIMARSAWSWPVSRSGSACHRWSAGGADVADIPSRFKSRSLDLR